MSAKTSAAQAGARCIDVATLFITENSPCNQSADLRFFGPQGLEGPHGFAAFFLAGPQGFDVSDLGAHGFFCSALEGGAVSADFAIGAAAIPASIKANAVKVDFLDIYITNSNNKKRFWHTRVKEKRSTLSQG
jgi:hypothetical protein